MTKRNKKVTCCSCGEKIDPYLATNTEKGFLCDDCQHQLENEDDEELDINDDSDSEEDLEDEELDFYDDSDSEEDLENEELDLNDDDLDGD